jgi:hypothetical protein
MEDEEMAVANSDYLVTETTLDPKISVDAVVSHLRARKVTGQLVFHLSQGGVQKVALVERTKATMKERKLVRELLGV